MYEEITQEQALEELEKGYDKAAKVLKKKSKFDDLMEKTEQKLKSIPKAGEVLSNIPVLAQLLKSAFAKEYKIPLESMLAIASALIYFVAPFDLIPDIIPVIGYLDDIAVITACLYLLGDIFDDYKKWRESRNIGEVEPDLSLLE